MSTLSVTNIQTANGTTDLTLLTGNTNAGDIIISSNGTLLTLAGNSSTNTIRLSPNGHIVFANTSANTFTFTSTGTATIGNHVFSSGSIELNNNGSGDRNALVDFHSDDTYTDYSFRMLAAAGNNGIRQIVARGTGGLYLDTTDAAAIVFRTTGVEAARITAGGNVTIASNTLNLGTSTAAANGYTFLPNGLKMVWGMVAAANTAAGTFATYASAFTTATYVVQVSHQGNARTVPPLVVASNTTGANISSGIAATTGTNVYFTAIGI